MSSSSGRRRAYGSGSIVERDGNWYGQWYPAPGARRVWRKLGTVRTRGGSDGITKAMAEAKLRELIAEHAATLPVVMVEADRSLTVEKACRLYLVDRQGMNRKATTLRGIESAHRNWIVPTLGDRRVATLTKHDQAALASALRSAGRAPKYVRNVVGEFAALCNWLVDEGHLVKSPADLSKLGKQERRARRIRYFTVHEVDHLVRRVPDDEKHRQMWQTLFFVAAHTGLRLGELRALKWADVDFAAEAIRVFSNVDREFDIDLTPDRTRPREGKRRTTEGTTKTVASERRVPLAEEVIAWLDRWYVELGQPVVQSLVFPSPRDGGPLGETTVGKALIRACDAAGLPHRTMHELRHSFGTAMAAAGIPMRTLQAWMGHEDIQTTNLYAHYAPAFDEAKRMTQAFRSLRENPVMGESQLASNSASNLSADTVV